MVIRYNLPSFDSGPLLRCRDRRRNPSGIVQAIEEALDLVRMCKRALLGNTERHAAKSLECTQAPGRIKA
jgi:hypothetical protein